MAVKTIDLRGSSSVDVPRPARDEEPLAAVRAIIDEVRSRGDEALRDFTERFDGVKIDVIAVPSDSVEAAMRAAPSALVSALEEAERRIRAFAEHQKMASWSSSDGGTRLGEVIHPLGRAGIYVPGGRATYPSSVLMSAVPARVAGVGSICLCVPPGREGEVPQATLVAARIAGMTEIYRVGGAHAIAAMAFGTASIAAVDVIVGPGNIYVALAKREVAGTVAIDSIAGPSEIAIVGDAHADPRLIAFDLIAQAEHGPGGSFLVVTWEEATADAAVLALRESLDEVQASDALRSAIDAGTVVVLVESLEQAVAVINAYAPEHLELLFEGAEESCELFSTAGAIFIGAFSPVPLGDYLAGSNHVLPTAGAGRWASGLRASHFQRASAFVRYDRDGLRGALAHLETLSSTEGLPNHARAVRARFEDDG